MARAELAGRRGARGPATGLAGLALLVPLALSSCTQRDPRGHGPPGYEAPLDTKLIDDTGPGELAEGKEEAFGLRLPRRMRVERRYPDAVFVRGNVTGEQAANYVRARVVARSVDTGPSKTLFSDARVRGAEATGRLLRLEVVSSVGSTELVVRDVTPPAVEPGLTEEDRWKKHGLSKDGKVLDPSKLE